MWTFAAHQIRHAVCPHFGAQLIYGQIGPALVIRKATVGKTVLLARAASVDWAAAQTLSDAEL